MANELPRIRISSPNPTLTVVITSDRLFDVKEFPQSSLVGLRTGGVLRDRAFYLVPEFDWVLGKDEDGATVLVPLKKDKD